MIRIIAGQFKNISLFSTKGETTRPTTGQVREAIFNRLQNQLENRCVLDLFAGSGALGFEALSRGAAEVVFIEKDKKQSECIRKNIEKLGVSMRASLFTGDVFSLLPKLKQTFDLIFADPPYGMVGEQLLTLVDQLPVLRKNGELWLEESASFVPSLDSLSSLRLLDERKYGNSKIFRFDL